MSRTLPVTWHEDRITGCVERAAAITAATDADQPCHIAWLDLACLLDMARAWLNQQEHIEPEPAHEWCEHPDCFDRTHGDMVHSDEHGRPFTHRPEEPDDDQS